MTRFLLLVALCGCGEGDPIYVTVYGGEDGTVQPEAPREGEAPEGLDLSTASKVEAFLEGKRLTMRDGDIPTHPNGFDSNVNFGQATQCYHSVEIDILAGRWTTRSILAVLEGASDVGAMGTCEQSQQGADLEFPSTAILVTNVMGNGECFDVTATYAGFAQEGRGGITPDGSTVNMEFFFKDQAVGHRCAEGAVGQSGTVTLNDEAFSGDAVQVYRVTESP